MNSHRLYNLLLNAHVTEKTSQISGGCRQYAFEVLSGANKFEIRQAVEQLFKVKVRSVKTCNVSGKRKRGQIPGQTKGWKKAYVVLKENQEIDLTKIQ